MRQKTYKYRVMWHLVAALTVAVSLCLIRPSMASAQNLAEYFQLSYAPVTFDKSEIYGSEIFHATITGRASCTQGLPMSVGEASLTSQVLAVHAISGTTVTLNPGYTINIKPFPSKQDETVEINQTLPLQFPAQAEPGDYKVIGKIVEGKVKVVIWLDVTSYLPKEQQMGVVKYTAAEATTVPPPSVPPSASKPQSSPAPQLTPTPTPTPTPPIPTPTPTSTATPPETIIPWWVELIGCCVGATTIFKIFWFLRQRFSNM